jgi:hypothetical protein
MGLVFQVSRSNDQPTKQDGASNVTSKFLFCRLWASAYKNAPEPWSAKKAEAANKAKKTYTVLVDSIERPTTFIDVMPGKGKFCVNFLDEHLRDWRYYFFNEVEPGLLFMTQAVTREYLGVSDEITCGELYSFQRDGTVEIRRHSYNPDKIESMKTTGDVSNNYSPTPAFGEYDDLIRIQRQILNGAMDGE